MKFRHDSWVGQLSRNAMRLAFVRALQPTMEGRQRLLERTTCRIRALVSHEPPIPELRDSPEPKFVAQFDGIHLHRARASSARAELGPESKITSR